MNWSKTFVELSKGDHDSGTFDAGKPLYPIPVFLIAQLAVHAAFQGRGLGKAALVRALRHLWEINAPCGPSP